MADIQVFTTLSKEITTLTSTFTTEVMQNIAANITPVVIAGLVLYFTIYGVLILNQTIQQPLNDFLMEIFKISIITSIALTGGIYQDKIADIIINLPEDFAKTAFNSADDTFAVADSLLTVGLQKSTELYKGASILADGGFGKICIALIIGLSTALLGGIGGGLLLMVKVNCTILAAIGPLFIVALLFKQTRQLFSNWLGEIIGYGIFSLMLTVIFVFILKLCDSYLTRIKSDDNMFAATFVFLVLVIISGFLFFGCKKMAQRLSGVFSMGLAGRASDIAGQAISNLTTKVAGSFAKSAVKGAKSGAVSSGKYAANKAASWRKKRN